MHRHRQAQGSQAAVYWICEPHMAHQVTMLRTSLGAGCDEGWLVT